MTASIQKFGTASNRLLKEARTTGKNITKAQVGTALETLKADGKVSKADKEAASAFMAKAPLTPGAKQELESFIKSRAGGTKTDHTNSGLNVRLRNATGGGESAGSTIRAVRAAGGEATGRTVRTGGGESSGRTVRDILNADTGGGGRVGGGE